MTQSMTTPEYRMWYQKNRRRYLRESGGKRLDLWLSPDLWKKLKPHLTPYGGDTHPGHGMVLFLESLMRDIPETTGNKSASKGRK